MSVSSATSTTANGENVLKRAIDWKGAFWVASGVPALVVFSIGGIAGTVGIPAYTVWIVSMIMGFIQSFTYAEIAGLFPNKSGGASVYGAAAWLRYGKFIAPLVGVVQLGRLDAGALARLGDRGGLHPQPDGADAGRRRDRRLHRDSRRPPARRRRSGCHCGADADPQLVAVHHQSR